MSRGLRIKNKKRFFLFIAIGLLLLTGGAFALNGAFGGGAKIPEDTMTRGLVGYWNFEEGVGTSTADISGNGNLGAIYSATTSWARGKIGGALSFDGSNDYVDIGNVLDAVSNFSVSAWVNLTSNPAGTKVITGKMDMDAVGQPGWAIYVDSSAKVTVVGDAGSGNVANTALTLNTWTLVTVVRDSGASVINIYLNGVLDRSISNVTMSSNSVPLRIGANSGTANRNFPGLIDEVKVYNRALSAAEVRYHYNRGGPVGWWKFDEGSGTTTYDGSGNNNTGSIYSASSSWTTGKQGSALSFDGVDDYVQASISQGTTTVSFWMSNNGNQWQHVVNNNGTYYINGTQQSSAPSPYPIYFTANNVQIGKTGASAYFAGLIDDVRIYNYARTADEIRLDYNAGFGAKFGPSITNCDLDPGACMTKGLVGYWPFEEGQGTSTADVSGNSNLGSIYSATTSWVRGRVGSALSFDGSNDYVDAGNNSILRPTSAISLGLWVKPSAINGYLVSMPYTTSWSTPYFGYGVYYETANSRINFRINVGGTEVGFFSANNSVLVDQWYHVALTFDGVVLKGYINGVSVGSSASSGSISYSGSPKLAIGSRSIESVGEYGGGTIDEVRVYNRALSAAEVRYHYNRGGPVGWWKFDEGASTTAYDASGNGNNGILTNMAVATSSWVSGKYGSALSFDGVNDYMNAGNGNSINPGSGDFTIEGWFKFSATPPIYYVWLSNTTSGGLSSVLDTDRFSIGRSLVTEDNTFSVTIPIGEWFHVAITRTGGNAYGYYNGRFISSSANTKTFNSGNVILGIDGDLASLPLNGLIDDVRIYNYARTADEIRLDYNAGFAAKFGPGITNCDLDPGACMTRGLVGYWPFEEGQGTSTADVSGNSNLGAIYSATTSWARGKVGGALSFDGSNDYVNVPAAASLDIESAGTVEAWFKPAALYGGVVQRNDGGGHYGNDRLAVYIGDQYHGYTDFGAKLGDGNNADAVRSNVTPTLGTWYHVALTWDGGKMKIYINGELKGTTNQTLTPEMTGFPLLFGYWDYDAKYLNGTLDEIKIYNRALSAAEVRYHYNKGLPVGWWKFDEGSGTTTYDGSGNGNNGSIYSASSSWTTGKFGGALSFDGVDDYVSAGNGASVNITGTVTVSAWVKPNVAQSGSVSYILSKADTYLLDFDHPSAASRGSFRVTSGGVTYSSGGPVTISQGIWQHLVGVYDGAYVRFYVDGVEKSSNNIGSKTLDTFANNVIIGSYSASTYPFNGLIDDVRIYNYARTPEQILQDYNSGYNAYFR